jgi:hypothetical protein
MLDPRWTYSNGRRLTQWYGHVDYYGPCIIGQWFVLDAETGKESWARRFRRPNTVQGVARDVIVASEMRSDGPWTVDYGIYGIDAKTGALLWTNHGRGFRDTLCRGLDYVPGFTNELRDSPEHIVGKYLLTRRKRVLDIRTGQEQRSMQLEVKEGKPGLAEEFYDNKCLPLGDGDTLGFEGMRDEFLLYRSNKDGHERWRFLARDHGSYVEPSFYSFRMTGDRIFVILGDGPAVVPVNPARPMFVKPNPVNYQLGIIDIESGECTFCPLVHAARRTDCRIEAIRDSRLLISCDGTILTEYEISPPKPMPV